MIRRNIFVFLLIITVFISGNGVVCAIHICFSSSTKTVSLFEDQSCNGNHTESCHDEEGEQLTSKCCLLQYSYFKLNLPSDTKPFQMEGNIAPAEISTILIFKNEELHPYMPFKEPRFSIDIPILFSQLLI